MFLAVVDIVHLTSSLLIATGPAEQSLAVAAYGGSAEGGGKILELEGLVSRKLDFVPPLTQAFANGWKAAPAPAEAPPESPKRRKSSVVMDFTGFEPGRLQRVFVDDDDGED
jgi:hypothetical protein